MEPRPKPRSPKWAEALRRFAAASETEERIRLRRYSLQEGLALFAQLCRESDALAQEYERQLGPPPPRRDHPVGLVKIWKQP